MSGPIKGLQMWHKDRLYSERYKRCIKVSRWLDARSSYRLVLVVLTPIIYSLLSLLLKSEESSPLRMSALCSPLQSPERWCPILYRTPWCFLLSPPSAHEPGCCFCCYHFGVFPLRLASFGLPFPRFLPTPLRARRVVFGGGTTIRAQ